ncbi:hypothetical protein F4805DRAFT_474150 [Annulohypoxylon moriforme]|nr:hypothetical protein F4805DRAFT_474150 [Annulohypoxylon moriforme]
MEQGEVDVDLLKSLQGDLRRKYQLHGSRIEQIWNSLSQADRSKAMKAGAADGAVLKHPLDSTLGSVCKFLPDWNLRDVTAPDSDYFLRLLKHRATKSLEEQYREGFDNRPGDHAHILSMMETRGLRHVNSYKDSFSTFWDEEQYGKSFAIQSHREQVLSQLDPAIRSGVCVPQSMGELILSRQLYMMQLLNIMIEDVLEVGSTTRSQQRKPKRNSPESVSDALSRLTLTHKRKPAKVEVPDLIANSLQRKYFLDEYLGFLCAEPAALASDVNIWFFSRPELVADDKGRTLPVHTDRHISPIFLEVVHGAVKGAALWNCIYQLLRLIAESTNKAYTATLLQELSNVCHLEYGRTQDVLRRHISTGTALKWFKRVSNSAGSRLSIKGDPEQLVRENPQLYYLLRLCQPETNVSKAVGLISKISQLHGSHPQERDNLLEREADSLCDLAIIVGFTQSLSATFPLPSFSRNKGRMFVSRMTELESELAQIKTQIDLTEFVAPIDNLLEPGVNENALKALDQFILEKMGAGMGFLYEDLISECTKRLSEQQIKDKVSEKAEAEFIPLPSEDPAQPQEARVQERRQKLKTRPAHSSIYEIIPSERLPVDKKDLEALKPTRLTVRSGSAETFSSLFSKSEARGSIPWTSFESAMSDLGFSVIPEYGSVYTFAPTEKLGFDKSIKIHRPHQSRIEGHKLLFIARILSRTYGWTKDSFQVV